MKTDKDVLIINNTAIPRGTHIQLSIPMPTLYDCTPLHMPVHIIRGDKPGPCVCVTAAIHGDELNGIEIARRLIRKTHKKIVSGSLIVIPIVNMYGFLHQSRYLMDRRDLNRTFPGSKKGSLASRLAHLLSTEIITHATHVIDLHAGSLHRINLPHIRTNFNDPINTKLAKIFNIPLLLHSALRDGSLREYAQNKKIHCLLYEAGESSRFDEPSIQTGLRGILNVLKHLKMTKLKPINGKQYKTHESKHAYWIRAPASGLFQPRKSLGKEVKEGELIAKIGNPMTTEERKLYSPISGIIIGQNNLPLVHEGAALFNIACFEEIMHVAEHIEEWKTYFSENYDE